MLADLPKSRGRFDDLCYFYVGFPSRPVISASHASWYGCPRASSSSAPALPWDGRTPLPKAGCGARFKSRQHWNRPAFGLKQWHLHRAGLVACRSKLLSHTIVFWAFCKALDYFRREITMEGYGRSRAGPPGTAGSLQSGARLCVARGSRKPPQPHARRMSSLLQYFLSIHCRHLGKGWITM